MEEIAGMNFVIIAGAYGSILLGMGRVTRLGGIGAAITCIIIGIFAFVRQLRKIIRYKGKKLRITKRINAVVINMERKRLSDTIDGMIFRNKEYKYIYTFRVIDGYEGVIFYDKLLLLDNVHVKGEKVSLLINEYNLKEFWFEEEDEPGKGILIASIVIIIGAVFHWVYIIRYWNRLPWN